MTLVNDSKDTQYYVTDPDFMHIPVAELMSKVSISRCSSEDRVADKV